MTDDDLFGAPAPALDSAPPAASGGVPSLPQDTDARLIARAAVAEGDANNPQSYQNIAGVIYNRMQKTGKTAAEILSEPGQFEAYGNGHIQKVDTSSPQFAAALTAAQPVLAGQVTVPYDSFYQPQIVAQRGVKPPFDPSQGTKIGTQLFGNGYQGSASDLTPEEQAQWTKLYGPQVPGLVDPTEAGQPSHGLAPPAQAKVGQFLSLRGLSDPNALPGSETNPVADGVAGRPTPTVPGTWHITTDGKLQQVGSNIDDYLPAYRKASSGPLVNRVFAGAGQGVADVGSSLNKLTGGAFAVGDPTTAALGETLGGPSIQQTQQNSLLGNAQQQQSYNMLHRGDPWAAGGRFASQLATTTPLLATGTEALEGLGPVGEFAAGAMRGNPFLTGASRAAGGALQGAGAAALTSATSDRPVGEQAATGALVGGILGPLAPAVAGAGANLLTGRTVASPVAELADLAANKYGINLRAGQIRGANGDRAAWTADSNLLGSNEQYRANNEGQRQAWMRGVTSTYGDPSGDVSPEALSDAKDRIGETMNGVATRTPVIDASDVPGKLDAAVAEASQVLGENDAKPLQNLVDNIKSVIGPDGTLTGTAYQGLTRSKGPLGVALGKADTPYVGWIKSALDDALEGSANPDDVSLLQNARWQYKNLMMVAKLAPKADASGVISPALLRGAVGTSFKNQAFQGAGDPGELAQIGQTFMKEPPNSFSADRGKDFLGPLGILAGGEGIASLIHNPSLAAQALPAAIGAWALQKGLGALKASSLGPGAGNRLIQRSLVAPANPLLGVLGQHFLDQTYVPALVLGAQSQAGSGP